MWLGGNVAGGGMWLGGMWLGRDVAREGCGWGGNVAGGMWLGGGECGWGMWLGGECG